MAIADTITSMQNHTSNAYTMIGYGTDLTGINKNLQNLSSTIFDAFLEALRTPDTLFTNLPKKSGTGANITLNDTANAPMRITLSPSELTQAGTPTPSSPQDIHTISGSNTILVRGKNLFDKNNYNLFNGYLNSSNMFLSRWQGYMVYIKCEPSTTYTISRVKLENNFVVSSSVNVPTENEYATNSTTNNTATSITYTTGASDNYLEVYLKYYGDSDYTIAEIVDSLQIEVGSTATTYTPYISQEAEVDLSSKNLAFTNWAEDFVNRINDSTQAKIEVVAGKKCLYYTAGAGYNEYDTKYLFTTNWKTNTQYSFRFNIKPSVANTYNLCIEYTDGTTQRIDATTSASTWSSYNMFSSYANKTIKYVRAYWSSGNCYIDIDTFMVYEGTQELSYMPYYDYGEYCKIGNYEDKFIRTSGKNLFNKDTITENKRLGSDGAPYSDSSYSLSDYIEVEPSTTYCYNRFVAGGGSSAICYYDASKTFISRETNLCGGTSGTNGTYTTPNNAYYVRLTDLETIFLNIMFSKGSSTLDYEPYGSNEWYIKKNIGKYTITSDNASTLIGGLNTTTYSKPYITINKSLIGWQSSWTQNICLINTYKAISSTSAIATGTFAVNFIQSYICIFNENFTDLETAEQLMVGTEIYIAQATPTYTQITGTLETQLEQVYKNMLSYDGTTNISQVNNDLAFNMSVQALENLNV